MDLKCVVIGPPQCGKTSLITKYMTGKFPYVLHAEDKNINYNINLIYRPPNLKFEELNDKKNWNFSATIFDFNIDEHNNDLQNIDTLIMCFDITSKVSLHLLENFYRTYIITRWPFVPKILVGCLSDLLKDDDVDISISIDDIHAIKCSALENENVEQTFLKSFKLAAEKFENVKKYELEDLETEFLQTDVAVTQTYIGNNESGIMKIREIPIQHIKSNEFDDCKNWTNVDCTKFETLFLNNQSEEESIRIKETKKFEEKMTQTNSTNGANKLKIFFLFILLFIASITLLVASCSCQVKDACVNIYHDSKTFLNESIDSFNELIVHATDFSTNFL